jgi:3-oxoacyl-[acyl-carrier protein] reductase
VTDPARLDGKTAIITGAASGMGRASVARFLELGANVVAVDRDAAGLATLDLPAARAATAVVDVTDEPAVHALVADAIDRFGQVDTYFNNAGVPMRVKPMWESTVDEWRAIADVNVIAILIAVRAVIGHMRERRNGSFLVTSSTGGLRPRPNMSAYTASKAAAITAVKTLALEIAADGVRANVICPVAADTPMLAEFEFGGRVQTIEQLIEATPMGRLATAEDVANVAAFLASDAAAFLTGVALPVDGGRTI